ncbi:MarR family winged helix-turn-helix transcriptional regulator [Croceicoccus sp. F390]|uniref:MarR family winged helix-turn-helix transcriptional regulator n=2 Tax=Croceicoccus esteveae TaxID=3075597 RepID=A0ABU2ZGI1_9SPHN|nr:MarR family winged helix-turn-helix transcriptional regulator [Croceicoccus sp. F390]MDT0575697.1 MarR family winged helix-turn-helix transcriptional regulator [Croceicoccus sp. F390]
MPLVPQDAPAPIHRAERRPRLADYLPYRLSVASNAVSQQIAQRYRERFGLRISEWRIMAVLGDTGPQTQRQMVTATLMDKVAVNRACKILVDRQLISRHPNPQDGRSHMLELTASGAAMHAQIMPLALQVEQQLLECLSAQEVQTLHGVLKKLFAQARTLEPPVE